MADGRYPLFKGATRVPVWIGIPRNVMLGIIIVTATLFMTLHFWAFAVGATAYAVCWTITKHDDRMFRIIGLAFKTKVINLINSPFKSKWGGSSYSPVDYGDKD